MIKTQQGGSRGIPKEADGGGERRMGDSENREIFRAKPRGVDKIMGIAQKQTDGEMGERRK